MAKPILVGDAVLTSLRRLVIGQQLPVAR